MIRQSLFTFIVLVTYYSHAQKNIHKFGKIPPEEIKMQVYEEDSAASAVVLLNTGLYKLSDYKFYVHKRIKILKEAGKQFGNFTLNVPSKGDIKASTFNVENGEVVEYKLKKSEIIEEEITENLIVYKVFLPNVKVGSIVEISYNHFGLPYSWNFQEMIPVKYTEFAIGKSQYFTFNLSHYGSLPLKNLGHNHWQGRFLPAFKPEPMMLSIKNNLRRVELEIQQVSIPGVFYREYSTSWEKVSERLLELSTFGYLLRNSRGYLNDKGKELKNMEIEDEEKIQLAYEYITSNIEWNGSNGIYASEDHRRSFMVDHSGSVADINLNLISLLRKAEVQAFPVVLSTKSNGYLKKYQPSENKLNYVVCLAKDGDKSFLLDASSKNTGIGVLPPKCLNGDGWVVTKGEFNSNQGWGYWIPLEPERMTYERSFAQVEIDVNGDVKTSVSRQLNLYDYLDWKKNYDKDGNDNKYVRSLDEKYEDISVKNYKSTIDEQKMSIKEKFELDLTSKIENFGNELIIDPFVFSYDLENPFKSDERLSPVDLGYKYALDRKIMIKIPDNLEIGKLPEPIEIGTEDGKAQFAFNVMKNANTITLNYSILVKNPVIKKEDYPILKTFYSLMIDKLNESVTFKKTT